MILCIMNTPNGVIDFLPQDAKKHKDQFDTLNTFFSKQGYEFVKTPTIEYFDSLSKGLGNTLKQASIKFFDSSGELLMLKPDHTAPIARLVSTQMTQSDLPLKLYYMDSIFRKQKYSHDNIETIQAGCELIGVQSAESDAAIIELCYSSLKALGFDDIGIDIGHINFIKSISEENKQALLEHDYISYGSIPRRTASNISDPYLKQVTSILDKNKIVDEFFVNEGLVQGIHYYTGIIFELYLKSNRHIVASGGRYDNLLSQFGYNQPAVGFALNLSMLRNIKS